MFYHLSLKTLLCVLLASPSWAAPKKGTQMTHYMAIATANSVNRWGTVEEYQKALGRYVTASDMAKLNAEFTKYGIKPKDRFPKMISKENKAYFDKENYILYDKKTMTVNGKKLSLKKATPAVLFISICQQLGCEKTTANFSLFSKAHARFNSSNALLGALALGAGAALFTNDQSPQGRKQAGLRGGLVGAILAGLFLNNESSYSCGGQCDAQCDGDDYTFRRDDDYRYMDEPRRGRRGSDDRSGATRVYADDYRRNPEDYRVSDTRHRPCDSQYQDELACDIGARNCSSGGGHDELSEDIGNATVVDKNNGEAKRGTTSLPAKKK